MNNRGKISTSRIAEKLKEVEKEIEIGTQTLEHLQDTPVPLLFINGRLDRKHCQYVAKNFSLLSGLNQEIKDYCKGVDLTLLNYLIYRGLESIKQEKKFTIVEYSEIEKKYKTD